MPNEGNLRVWNIVNPPNNPRHHPVGSPEEGRHLITKLANHQLKDESIVSNAFGLEIFEDGEWCEWYNELGEDIDSAFESN